MRARVWLVVWLVVAITWWGPACDSEPAAGPGDAVAAAEPESSSEVADSTSGGDGDLGGRSTDAGLSADVDSADAEAAGGEDAGGSGPDPEPEPDPELEPEPEAEADVPTTDVLEPQPDVDVGPDAVEPGPLGIGPMCFAEIWDPEVNGPDYDQYEELVVAEHCYGTNHQAIAGVEKVVFLGDSVTVGTPNLAHPLSTDNGHFWRNKLADWLAAEFGLDTGNAIEWGFWRSYDYVSGKGGALEAGDFRNCAKWGARTDDLLEGGAQIPECFPEGGSDAVTLIVFTMGGNDVNKISQLGFEASAEEVAAGYPETWAAAEKAADYLREALLWLKDPANFPNGSYVVFANPFEFTDGTGDVNACPVAGLTGLGDWEDQSVQEAVVIWFLEQFTAIAEETGTDVIWLLEHFCGHGYVATGPDADTDNRCYRGPDTELYFDETCIHPNDAGHAALAEMFQAAIAE